MNEKTSLLHWHWNNRRNGGVGSVALDFRGIQLCVCHCTLIYIDTTSPTIRLISTVANALEWSKGVPARCICVAWRVTDKIPLEIKTSVVEFLRFRAIERTDRRAVGAIGRVAIHRRKILHTGKPWNCVAKYWWAQIAADPRTGIIIVAAHARKSKFRTRLNEALVNI
jgi:hypothetical protein